MNKLLATFVDELKDIYDAEQQITKALPKMIKAATHDDLRMALQLHLAETENQIRRLEGVFTLVGEKPKAKECKAMKGLLAEGEELIKHEAGDAALIAGAQKVEHYEIATYGSLIAWAKLMNRDDIADVLEDTLAEEKAADETLTEVAETCVNIDEEAQTKN